MHQEAIERAALIYRESQALTVGFTPEVILNCYPALLLEFQKRWPQIQLDSVPVNISSGCDPLRFKTVDMMFTYDCWVRNNPDLDFIPLKESQFYCVVHCQDALAQKAETEQKDFFSKTIIITSHNDKWIKILSKRLINAQKMFGIQKLNIATSQSALSKPMSAFPSFLQNDSEKNDVLFIPFNRKRKITLVLAWRKGELSESGRSFAELCQTKPKNISF